MRNSAEDKIKLIFVRHGLTPANEGRKYCGRRNDEDLTIFLDELQSELLTLRESVKSFIKISSDSCIFEI